MFAPGIERTEKNHSNTRTYQIAPESRVYIQNPVRPSSKTFPVVQSTEIVFNSRMQIHARNLHRVITT